MVENRQRLANMPGPTQAYLRGKYAFCDSECCHMSVLTFWKNMSMRKLFVALLALPLLMADCGKDDLEDAHEDIVGSDGANTVVAMSMAYTHNGAAFDTSMTLTDGMGRAYKISRLRFFMSMIRFTDDNNDSVAAFPEQHLLVDMAEGGTIRTIGQLSGHLHEMHFGLGVDSAVNHVDPTTLPHTDPLSDVTMWWGWAVGHLFLTVDGRYDSDQDGVVEPTDDPMSYHCGNNTLYTPVTLHVHTDADQGGNVIIPLSLDIDTLMASMNIAGAPVDHDVTPVTQALMQKLAAGLSHVE